jgi:hypothetical protein
MLWALVDDSDDSDVSGVVGWAAERESVAIGLSVST